MLVSVLMPVRNPGKSFRQAIASILCQTHGEWELLLVQDGTQESVAALVREFNDRRIRLLDADSPGGRSAARQTGLKAARGDYLAFLDADDWMYPWRLERQVALLEKDKELALVCGGMMVEDRRQQPAGVRKGGVDQVTERIFRGGVNDPPVLNAACMVRTEVARSIGYDTSLSRGEDADFFYRYLLDRKFLLDPGIVYVYREYDSFTAAGLRTGLALARRRKARRVSRPGKRAGLGFSWLIKRVSYELALGVAGPGWILRRRSRPASDEELAEYHNAIEVIGQVEATDYRSDG